MKEKRERWQRKKGRGRRTGEKSERCEEGKDGGDGREKEMEEEHTQGKTNWREGRETAVRRKVKMWWTEKCERSRKG